MFSSERIVFFYMRCSLIWCLAYVFTNKKDRIIKQGSTSAQALLYYYTGHAWTASCSIATIFSLKSFLSRSWRTGLGGLVWSDIYANCSPLKWGNLEILDILISNWDKKYLIYSYEYLVYKKKVFGPKLKM